MKDKNSISVFDKIVNKLSKSGGKIITIDDILPLVCPEQKNLSAKIWTDANKKVPPMVYKTIYRLKALGLLLPLKNGVYYVQKPNETKILQEVVDDEYWQVLRRVGAYFGAPPPIITGNKALELYLKDQSIPDEILCYSDAGSARFTLSPLHTLRFFQPKDTRGDIPLHRFATWSEKIVINGIDFRIAKIELALLESLLHTDKKNIASPQLIARFLSRFSSQLQPQILAALVSFRYITALNRLKEIAKALGYTQLYQDCLDIIKKEGKGCFVSVDVSAFLR